MHVHHPCSSWLSQTLWTVLARSHPYISASDINSVRWTAIFHLTGPSSLSIIIKYSWKRGYWNILVGGWLITWGLDYLMQPGHLVEHRGDPSPVQAWLQQPSLSRCQLLLLIIHRIPIISCPSVGCDLHHPFYHVAMDLVSYIWVMVHVT